VQTPPLQLGGLVSVPVSSALIFTVWDVVGVAAANGAGTAAAATATSRAPLL
jgi:hypothetical protein